MYRTGYCQKSKLALKLVLEVKGGIVIIRGKGRIIIIRGKERIIIVGRDPNKYESLPLLCTGRWRAILPEDKSL